MMKKNFLTLIILGFFINIISLAKEDPKILDHPEIKDKKELVKILIELKEKKDIVNYKNYILNLVATQKIKLEQEVEVLNAFNLESNKLSEVLNKSIDFNYSNTPAKIGESCIIRKCDSNSVCNIDPKETSKSCKPKASLCQLNSECCSGVCDGAAADVKGRCSVSIICHKGLRENESCEPKFNLCLDKYPCLSFSHLALNIGECKLDKNKCNSNDDCCSDNCINGKCEPKFTCQNCVKEGRPIKRGQKCCEGLREVKGKNKIVCTMDLPI